MSSFAMHWVTYFHDFKTLAPRLVRNNINYSIIWLGHTLSAINTFGTSKCRLCNKEKLEIMKREDIGR